MSIKLPWVLDPKDNKDSISLSLLVVFGLAALVLNVMKALGKISDVASINELFYSALALYFSRRNINVGGKTFSANKAEEIKEKVISE